MCNSFCGGEADSLTCILEYLRLSFDAMLKISQAQMMFKCIHANHVVIGELSRHNVNISCQLFKMEGRDIDPISLEPLTISRFLA